MSGATALKPAAATAGSCRCHTYQVWGNPWQNTTAGPDPSSATCMLMPLVGTWRWRSPGSGQTVPAQQAIRRRTCLPVAMDSAAVNSESRDLSGRVAVVTGASRGIGKGIALELGAAGATVYATGRSASAGNLPGSVGETAEQIDQLGGRGIGVVCDHSDDDAVALWDHVVALASFPGFAELKRSLREQPQLPSFGVRPGAVGVQEDWHGGSRRLKR